MKKTLLTVAAMALAIGSGFADQTINITGATAFRKAANEAIQTLMSAGAGGSLVGNDWSTGSGSNSATDAQWTIWKGTISGISGNVTIRTNFQGSVEGIQDVVQQNDIAFIPATITFGNNGGETASDTGKSNLAWSDVWQGSTTFTSTPLTDIKTTAVPPAVPRYPGVVTFLFGASELSCNGTLAPGQVAGNKINSSYSMTNQLFRLLAQNGEIKLSALTGNSTHSAKTLYLTGRYPGSGTRITALANTGYKLTDPVIQYKPLKADGSLVTSASETIAKLQVWPTVGVPATTGDDPSPGNGGYTSGGQLRAALGASMNGTVEFLDSDGNSLFTANGTDVGLVSYTGKSDGNNAGSAGMIFLPYNGVSATDGTLAVTDTTFKSGTNTFWSYEHMLQRGTNATETSLAQKIVDNLSAAVTSPGFKDDTAMTVERTDDGALVTPK